MSTAPIGRVEDFIRARMPLRALPFRPDISIHTPTAQSGLNAWLASEGHDRNPPYWAYAWGGGAALALYLHDHPEAVAGRTVLDFGAGSGLVGIAAAKAGAAQVLAIEADPLGQVALRLNAEANGVDLRYQDGPDLPLVDVVLAGDVFYSGEVTAKTLATLTELTRRGARIVIGDPFRRDLPLHRLEMIARYPVPDMGGARPVDAGIFVLRPDHIGNAG